MWKNNYPYTVKGLIIFKIHTNKEVGDVMKIEIKRGSRGNPLMVVTFEKASNYDPEKHEWVPKLEEVGLIYKTLKSLAKLEEIE